MKLYVFVFLIASCISAHAQHYFGIKGGLNISDIVITNYIDPDAESNFNLKAGLHAGAYYASSPIKKFGVGVEILYSNKGVNAGGRINLHYVVIPLLLRYYLSENVCIEAGPELGYLMVARSNQGNASAVYSNKLDLGLDCGIAYQPGKLSFTLRYNAGLLSVRDPFESTQSPGEKVRYQNRVLQFSMGYKLFQID